MGAQRKARGVEGGGPNLEKVGARSVAAKIFAFFFSLPA